MRGGEGYVYDSPQIANQKSDAQKFLASLFDSHLNFFGSIIQRVSFAGQEVMF